MGQESLCPVRCADRLCTTGICTLYTGMYVPVCVYVCVCVCMYVNTKACESKARIESHECLCSPFLQNDSQVLNVCEIHWRECYLCVKYVCM